MNVGAPSISVVIPVYNGMPYLSKCVDSVLSQLPDDGELVIRDNASTDGTSQWLQELSDPRIRILTAESTVPAAENWNLVLSEAKGKYVKLICADDELTEGSISRQLDTIRATDVALVASRRKIISAKGRTVMRAHGLGRNMYGRQDGRDALRKAILHGTNPFGEPASVIFKRELVDAAGGFETEFPYVTDIDFYSRLLIQGEFFGLATVDATFRVSQASWSAQIGKAQHREYVNWVNTLRTNEIINLNGFELIRFRALAFSKFVLRRASSTVINLLA